MSKKKKKNNNEPKRANLWGRLKLYGTIAFILWVSLAANGVNINLPAASNDGTVVAASAFGFLPSLTMATPGGVEAKPEPLPPVVGVTGPIRSIPDGLNNYRATSPTAVQLRQFLASSGTKKIMCLSGDIPGRINLAELQAIAKEFSVEYLTSGQLNRFAARSGYQEGKGFVRSAAAAARHLIGGNVLVIDRSGNRAGALIGAYLVSLQGFSVERAIAHNNWEAFAKSPGDSYQYLETVTGEFEKPEE